MTDATERAGPAGTEPQAGTHERPPTDGNAMHDDDGSGDAGAVTVRRMPGGLGSGPLSGGPGSHDVWEVDRLNHTHDLPRFCPECGRGIVDNGGIATEFWRADDRIYHVWCRECGWAGNISRVRRMVGPDSPH